MVANDSGGTSNDKSLETKEHLRKAYLLREVADLEKAQSLLKQQVEADGADANSEASLVLLAVNCAIASAHGDSEAQQKSLDLLEEKSQEIKNKASIPTLLVFRSLCELGRARLASGAIEQAGQAFRVALGLAQDEYGKHSLEMIYPSLCLAMFHERQGNNLLAMALARDAVSILRERANQINDPSLLVAGLIVINSCSFKERRFKQALEASDELLNLGSKSLSLASCDRLQEAATVKMASLAQLDRLQDAKDQGEVLVEAIEKAHGRYSSRLLEPLCQLAAVYERMGSRGKASQCLDQALVVVSHIVEDSPFVNSATSENHVSDEKVASMPFKEYQVLNRLSQSYLLQGKFVEMMKLYPSSMRARYTTYVASSTNMIDMLTKRVTEFAEEQKLKHKL